MADGQRLNLEAWKWQTVWEAIPPGLLSAFVRVLPEPSFTLEPMTGYQAQEVLEGRFGGISDGVALSATWDGARLTGRVGGYTNGTDVAIWLEDSALVGRVGGVTHGFDVRASIAAGVMTVRLGGFTEGTDVTLNFTPDAVTGRYGSYTDGLDVGLRHYAGEVRGRFGSFTQGVDVRLDLGAVPFPLGALLLTCALRLWLTQGRALSASR